MSWTRPCRQSRSTPWSCWRCSEVNHGDVQPGISVWLDPRSPHQNLGHRPGGGRDRPYHLGRDRQPRRSLDLGGQPRLGSPHGDPLLGRDRGSRQPVGGDDPALQHGSAAARIARLAAPGERQRRRNGPRLRGGGQCDPAGGPRQQEDRLMGRREGGLLYPRRTWLLDTGAGADTVPGTITKWEYEFPDGTDISGTLNMDTTVCPYAVFRCNGQLTISGAIDGDGDGSVGGAGGAVGVWDVDHWNTPPQPGSHGAGPGGGAGGATWINDTHVAGNGGGGGHAAEGTANPVGSTGGGEGGHIYSSLGAILQVGYGVWCSGSGGGGG